MIRVKFIIASLLAVALLVACEPATEREPISTGRAPLESIQDTIAAADFSEDAYYAKTYRFAEPKYWLRIAGWITEHALEREFIEKNAVSVVLDLGCGYGTLLALATQQYATRGICFDVIPYIQPEVQQRYGIEFRKLDIEKEPFPDDVKVDVVLMTEVIEHLNFHPAPTLSKIYQILEPGGAFFVSTPDADEGWGRVYDYYKSIDEMPTPVIDAEWIDGHIWQYTESEIRQVLGDAGFKIKRLEHAPGAVGLHFNIWAVKPKD